MLCYGYITLYAPPELAVSRLETNILNVVVPQLASVKVRRRTSVQFLLRDVMKNVIFDE